MKCGTVQVLNACSSALSPIISYPIGAAGTVLLIYMFCTDLWVIAAMYTAWLIFDWNTPKQGKYRSPGI